MPLLQAAHPLVTHHCVWLLGWPQAYIQTQMPVLGTATALAERIAAMRQGQPD